MKLSNKTINGIKNNDYRTIKEIYEKNYKLVYHILYKYIKNADIIADLSQEIFLKVFKNIDKYNNEFDFSSWLCRISTNVAIDFLRKEKNKIECVFDERIYLYEDKNVEYNFVIEEIDEKIRVLLSNEEYEILVYKIYLDYKFKEIAKIKNTTVHVITGKYYRAISKLKDNISKEEFYG